ncbi:MAG: hypothetical protein WC467_03265 [Patescibacteria group bacterium]
MKTTSFYIRISVIILGLFMAGSSWAATPYYVSDPALCPTEAFSQSCVGVNKVCGVNPSNVVSCYDTSTFNPPASSALVSGGTATTTGGYYVDCYAFDSASPYCNNNGAYSCLQNNTCNTLQKVTSCTAAQWANSTCGDCKVGYHDCDGNAVNGCSGATEHDGVACTTSLSLPGTYQNCVCVGTVLKLGADSLSGNSVIQGGAASMIFVNGLNVGIGTSLPNDIFSIGNAGAAPAGSGNTGHNFTSTYLASDDYALANYGVVKTLIGSATSTLAALWGGTLNGNIWNGAAGAGNVGIGTTNPTTILDVFNSGGSYALNLSANSATSRPGIKQVALRPDVSGIAYNMFEGYIGNVSTNLTRAGVIGVLGSVVLDPAISTVSYMYFGAETNAAYNNNTFRLYPNKNAYFDGNVGIGNAGPVAKLQVSGGNILLDNNYNLQIKNSGGTPFNVVGSSGDTIFFNSPSTLSFLSASSIKMSILSSGNIGIGTTAPNDIFSIGNSGQAPAGSANTGHNFTSTYLTTDNYALTNYGIVKSLISDATSSLPTVTNYWSGTLNGNIWNGAAGAGNVGIGTTTPSLPLHISANAGSLAMSLKTSAGYNSLSFRDELNVEKGFINYFGTGYVAQPQRTNRFEFATNGAIPIAFVVNNNYTTPALYLKSDGNVGIGTINPNTKLDILSGTVNAAADSLTAPTASITGPNVIVGAVSVNAGVLNIATNDALGINIGGSIGFGGRYNSTSQAGFAVIKGAKESATAGEYGGYLSFNTRAHGTQLSEKMRISGNGNVGIGTSSPQAKLQVAGSLVANYAAINLTPNGDFETGSLDGFTGAGFNGIESTDSKDGKYSAYSDTSLTVGMGTEFIPVDSDGYFYLEGWFKSVGASGLSTIYFGTAAYNSAKGALSGNGGSYGYCAASAAAVPNTWTKYTCTLHGEGTGTYQFPVGTKYIKPLFLFNYQGGTGYKVLVDGVRYFNGSAEEYTQAGNLSIFSRAGQGNVGIGTLTPNDKFSIGNAGSAPAGSSNTGHNYTNTYLSTDDYALANYGLVKTMIGTATGSITALWGGTTASNIWTLNGANNVGIGVTNPGYKLEIAGPTGSIEPTGLKIDGSNPSGIQIRIGDGYSASVGTRYSGADTFLAGNAYQGTLGADTWSKGNTTYSSAAIFMSPSTASTSPAFQIKYSPASTANGGMASFFTSNLLTILGNGNVGIGTTAPTYPLDVVGAVKSSSQFIVGASAFSANTFYSSASNFTFSSWYNSAVRYNMMILANGNVGIGTTVPNDIFSIGNSGTAPAGSSNTGHNFTSTYLATDDYALTNVGYVNSLIAAATSSLPAGGTNFWGGTLNGNIWNGDAGAGNVGIGTTTPGSALTINSATAGDGGTNNGGGSALYVKQNTAWTGAQPWALYVDGYTYLNGFRINGKDTARSLFQTITTYPLGFATSGDQPITFTQSTNVERMRIAAGGNIGIGTTAPGDKLQVAGNIRATQFRTDGGSFYYGTTLEVNTLSSTLGGTEAQILFDGPGKTLSFVTNGATREFIDSLGNIGIGTNVPNDTFSIGNSGSAPAGSGNTGHNYTNTYLSTDDYALTNYGIVQTLIAAATSSLPAGGTNFWGGTFNGNIWNGTAGAGNVGIGTSTPADKLYVQGNLGLPLSSSTEGIIKMGGQRYIHSFGNTNNIFVGYQAGNTTLTTATENTFIGAQAGQNLTTGSYNVAIGRGAGSAITTGTMNTLIGRQTGNQITTGSNNTLVGLGAGESWTGAGAVMMGYYAGRWNSTGNSNVILGFNSNYYGNANSDTLALGTNSLVSTVNGSYNIALGSGADYLSPGTGSLALAAGSNLGVGPYYYRVSFVLSIGETNSGHLGSINTTSGNQAVNLSAIPTYTGPYLCTARKIYRTKSGVYGKGPYYLVATINDNSTTTYSDTTADASLTSVIADSANSIVVGYNAKALKSNQIILGANQNDIYLGKGVYASNPGTISLFATGGLGTNNAGANLVIAGGPGTGSAIGGNITFQTADAGSSGSLFNSLSDRMTILSTGNIGIGTAVPNDIFSIGNSGSAPAGSTNTGHNFTNTYLSTDDYALVNYGVVKSLISGSTGGGLATYSTSTALTYAGNVGSYSAANALCAATVADTHVCTSEEILYTVNQGSGASIPLTSTLWINNGPPAYTANANDCIGWTSNVSTDFGAVWNRPTGYADGFGSLNRCNVARKFACCK